MFFLADFERVVIFEIADALRVPVLVLMVLALPGVLVDLGSFAVNPSQVLFWSAGGANV